MKVKDFAEVVASLEAEYEQNRSMDDKDDKARASTLKYLEGMLTQITPAVSKMLRYEKQHYGYLRNGYFRAGSTPNWCIFHQDGASLFVFSSDKPFVTVDITGKFTITEEFLKALGRYECYYKTYLSLNEASKLIREIIIGLSKYVADRHRSLTFDMTAEAKLLEEVRLKTLEALREPIVVPAAPPTQ